MATTLSTRLPNLPVLAVLIAAFLHGPVTAQSPFPEQHRRVALDHLRDAMVREAERGYDLKVVANATRFTAAVIIDLVRGARVSRPEGDPLLLHHDDWYEAYRTAAGLTPDSVPEFVSLQRDHRQSQYVDYRSSTTRVEVDEGPAPEIVLNVTAGWPDGDDVPDRYTFVDSAATPSMRVTNERIVTYRLVVFRDMVLQDKIRGIRGRPLNGALGTLFKIIGEGRAVQSRFAISQDGLLVTYATAKKGFISVKPVSVTYPDGTVEKGVPNGRSDLEEIAERLKQKIEIDYLNPTQ